LARFNVSNAHGEQHHFSFLGLPSPGAAAAVAATVLMQRTLVAESLAGLAAACVVLLPVIVLCTGLLMTSSIRYPHLVNRYLRGRRSIGRLLLVMALLFLLVVAHQYTIGLGAIAFAAWGPVSYFYARVRRKAL
jgi:phosphatidylserine synthase